MRTRRHALIWFVPAVIVCAVAGVMYWRDKAHTPAVPIGTEPTRTASGFLDPEDIDSLWALLSAEKREGITGALKAVEGRLTRANKPGDEIEQEVGETRRRLVQFAAMQDRFSGDARETEPFVLLVEDGKVVEHVAHARIEDAKAEGWAQSSMYVLAKAEAAVGLAPDQRERMFKQAERWSRHYDEDTKAWCAYFLTAAEQRAGSLPPGPKATLQRLKENPYVVSVLEQQAAELERSRKKAAQIPRVGPK